MRSSSLPAVLLAVCCALLAGTVLHAFRVPILASASAQTNFHPTSAPPVFNLMSPSALRPAKLAERQAATRSIAAQLAAFGARDYVRALQYQSVSLRHNFASVQDFRRMMETAYPQFLHARKVQYGPAQAEDSGEHILIPVMFTDNNGMPVKATYIMVREGEIHKPVYHIEGVVGGARRLPPPVVPGTGTDA